MGAFSAVAQGSHNPPRMIVLRYEPPSPNGDILLGLVGKAVTFDTGGISIKTALYMEDMKGDMAGGATVIEALGAVAELGLPLRTLAVVGADGEHPSAAARTGPGHPPSPERQDDRGHQHRRRGAPRARGRARARAAARRDPSARLRDSHRRDERRARRPLRRGHGERRCLARRGGRRRRGKRRSRLALADAPALPRADRLGVRRHEELLRACGRRDRRTPRQFLEEFVGEGPWAHIDMAGTGFFTWGRNDYLWQKGGTGYGVRLIVELGTPARGVNFDLSEEQELVRRTVRDFAEQKVAPVAEELDREHRFPYELVAELAELGLMGMPIPEEYGGGGADTVSYAIAIEELTRIDSSVAITVAAHTLARDDADLPLRQRGAEAGLAARPRLRQEAGRLRPHRARSRIRRRRDAHDARELSDGEWVINGSKIFITNAGTDITALRDDHGAHRRGRDLEHDRPERHARATRSRRRWRSSAGAHPTRASCRSRAARVPGGEPARRARPGLPPVPRDPRRRAHLGRRDGRRPRAGRLRPRASYAQEREQFGKPIASFQAIQFQLADMAVEIEAGRGARLQGGVAEGRGPAVRAGGGDGEALHGRALEPGGQPGAPDHGGYGFMDEFAISRLYRDQKILEIGEGTNEVQRMVIARHLGSGSRLRQPLLRSHLVPFRQFVDDDLGCASYLIGDETRAMAVRRRSRLRDRAVPEAERRRAPRADHARARDAHARRPRSGHGRLALEHGLPVSIHPAAGAEYPLEPLADGEEIELGDGRRSACCTRRDTGPSTAASRRRSLAATSRGS